MMPIQYRSLPTWTDERIDQLSLLWVEGLGQSEIARRLSMTRNMVIGKVNRLIDAGILVRRNEAFRPKPPTVMPKNRKFNPAYTAKTPPTIPEPEVLEPFLIDGKTVTIRTCNDRTCRYPFGDSSSDMTMCGRPPKPGAVYCEFHCKITHQPQHDQANRHRQAEKAAEAAQG